MADGLFGNLAAYLRKSKRVRKGYRCKSPDDNPTFPEQETVTKTFIRKKRKELLVLKI